MLPIGDGKELTVMIESKWSDGSIIHFHIDISVSFVHCIHSADVLIGPRSGQVEALVAKLNHVNWCRAICLAGDWPLQSDRFLLCANIIDNHITVIESNPKHQAIRMELYVIDGATSFNFWKQLTFLEIMHRPRTVIRTTNNEISNWWKTETSYVLVATNLISELSWLGIVFSCLFACNKDKLLIIWAKTCLSIKTPQRGDVFRSIKSLDLLRNWLLAQNF